MHATRLITVPSLDTTPEMREFVELAPTTTAAASGKRVISTFSISIPAPNSSML